MRTQPEFSFRLSDRGRAGFTLLELMTTLLVVLILVLMISAAVSRFQATMQKTQCMANLRSLHVGAEMYVQEHKSWPQIDAKLIKDNRKEYAKQWIAALSPYGLSEKNWHCPTMQALFDKSPKKEDRTTTRIDYISTPFDSKQVTPHQWSKQPWFVEWGDMHGNGNLMIFSDGSIQEMIEFLNQSH